MGLTPLQRKAEYARAVVLNGTTRTAAAGDVFGVSLTHLMRVFDDPSQGSADLKRRLADYCGADYDAFWQPAAPDGAAPATFSGAAA